MLDTLTRRQDDSTAYPTTGVRISLIHHPQTRGGYRLRLAFDRPVADILRRGLAFPRLVIDGDMVNGLRIYATQDPNHPDSMQPIVARSGAWSVFLIASRFRAASAAVPVTPVDFEWQLDAPGPVLLIPRIPDSMVPGAIIEKLPNSAVDPETRRARADKRLQREMAELFAQAPEPDAEEPPGQARGLADTPPPAPIDGEPVPDDDAAELRAAIALVNDLVDLIGDGVTLAIDERGHVTARRRTVVFVDL